MANDFSQDLASLRITRNASVKSGARVRWPIILSAVIAIVALVIGYTLLKEKLFKPTVQVGHILSISPAQADVTLIATGYVVPQRKATVSAKQIGRIHQLLVGEGQDVAEGQLIATLESKETEAALAESRASVTTAIAHLAGAKASLADQKQQFEREKNLLASGSTNQAAVDGAQSRYDLAIANVQAAEAEVQTANARMKSNSVAFENTKILAPFAGRVVRKLVEVGEVPSATGSSGATSFGIVELVDFNSLMVEADVSENKISLVKTTTPAEISLDAYAKQRFRGVVQEIRPTVDKQKATVLVKVKFVDSTDNVLPQMAARVLFLQKELNKDSLNEPPKTVIPQPAVVERGGQARVFVVSEGRVHLQAVTLGEKLGNNFELKQGPAVGTAIVLYPNSNLSDGTEIKERIE